MITVFQYPFVWGKPRPRFTKQGRAYKTADTRERMAAIATAYKGASIRAHGGVAKAPKGVPVAVYVSTERPLPKSLPKRIFRQADTVKPDVDNLLKGLLDALNGVAWADDTQVHKVQVIKRDRQRGVRECTKVLVMWEGEEHAKEH